MSAPAASLVIPTRNRSGILRECLAAALRQTVPLEIIVLDDGSTDDTAEVVRREFPQVRYERFGGPNGPAFVRNRGSELATAPILFPLDDDAVLASPRTVEQTLAEFDHPRVGAVGIPFINVNDGPLTVRQRAPGEDGGIHVCAAYVGASHALRRDVFLRLCGYRERLFYMGEEGDYCVRMLAAGYVTRLGRADPIRHHESPRRAFWRMDYYGRRNDILFTWHNVPSGALPVHLLGTTFNGVRYAWRTRRPGWMLAGLAAGYGLAPVAWADRRPLPTAIYRLDRWLRRSLSLPLAEIEPLLPALPA